MTRQGITKREPVRLFALIAGAISASSSFFIDLGADVSWETALGKALGILALAVGGGELGRSRAYSPAAADEIMDADSVISQLEAEGV